ncbi:MAG: PIG-L family deacetylase [Bacteroidales bacterium]|nr:PIG-L family deacetylase [Bacteroidales bacterium]MBK8884704.1 PIG-L family deacetylase [Bacteroidales bacterium]
MKKQFLLMLSAFVIFVAVNAQDNSVRVIVFGAHPDDCDLEAGGIAIKFAKSGYKVKFVAMTNGDAGHQSMGGGALAKRRMAEAQEAGRRFGVEYTVLDNHDGELMPTLENRLKVIREIRNWKADIVITHPSNDYHPDHRYTSLLVQDASFMVIVPNVAPDTPPLKINPVFFWSNTTDPDIAVDIDGEADQKLYAASAHESQFFEWLPWLDGTLEKVPANKEERLKFMKIWLSPPTDAVRQCLKKWYKEPKASQIKNAEAFKLADYSRKPDHDELLKLFPIIK